MHKTLLMSAALLGLASGPVLAQNTTSTTMSPPAPNAGNSVPQPTNSLPTGGSTTTRMTPGDNVGTTSVGPSGAMPMSGSQGDMGMTGMHPMRGQMHHGAMMGRHGRMAHGRTMPEDASAEGTEMGRGHEYRGGVGSPSSSRASNIDKGDTRSDIAPRLPDPSAASSTPEGYLAAAQHALASGKTGAAQEALERAETRVLSRSTDTSMAASPADMPMVQQIGAARRALASRDMAGAKAAINAALGNGT